MCLCVHMCMESEENSQDSLFCHLCYGLELQAFRLHGKPTYTLLKYMFKKNCSLH